MSIVEQKKGEMKEKEKEKSKKITYKIHPNWYSSLNYDENVLMYEVHLPGVDKQNVNLKILSDLWYVEASREEEKSRAVYTLTNYFPYEIDINSVNATYENGLLKFTAKIKDPLADAVDIKL